MTSAVEYRYARAKVKPIAGSPDGAPQPESSAAGPEPTAPLSSGTGTAVGVHLMTPEEKLALMQKLTLNHVVPAGTPPVDNAHVAEGAEQFTGATQAPAQTTGTAEQPQAGVVPTAAPATFSAALDAAQTAISPSGTAEAVPADVIAFLKAHPEAEAQIEKLVHQG